jgi:hypothetical protein
MRVLALAVLGAAIFALAGCGATVAFDGETYRDAQVAFRVPHTPTEWRPVKVSDAKLAFRDDTRDASILVTARCGIPSDDVPLQSLTGQLVMGTTEREYVSEDVTPFDGREAMHTVLRAKLDGVRMAYDVFVMKKNGCVYDLVYVAPPEQFDAGKTTFEAFCKGFRSLDPQGAAP